jgi:hypothetical protein
VIEFVSMSGAKPANERTKVVVRNLPPTLGLEAFKEVLDKHIPADSYNWLQYYPGKIRCGRKQLGIIVEPLQT